MSSNRRVAVLGGLRIPFARQNGPYAQASNQDMLTATIEGLVAQLRLEGERLGEVAAGAVLKHSRDFSLTRESVLGSQLAPQTPAYDVQQACGTGLETAILTANKIALGQIDSASPAASTRPPTRRSRSARTSGDTARAQPCEVERRPVKALARIRPQHIVPEIPRNAEPRTGLSMGEHAAITAGSGGSAASSRTS